MNTKEVYESVELDVIVFDSKDVITDSTFIEEP